MRHIHNSVPSKMGIDMPSLSGKRAAVNWTIGKLLNIILLVIVLVLVIYGLTTGGLNPLLEQLGGKIDSVLIMLNIKGDPAFDECYTSEVKDLGGGGDFLRSVGLEGESVSLSVCGSSQCNISGDKLDSYRLVNGKLERGYNNGKTWGSYSYLLLGDLNLIKKYYDVYNDGYDVAGKKVEDIFATWLVNRESIIKEHFLTTEEAYARKSFDGALDCGDCGSGPQKCRKSECDAIGEKLAGGCKYRDYWIFGSCAESEVAPVNSDLDVKLERHVEDLRDKFTEIIGTDTLAMNDNEYKIGIYVLEDVLVISFESTSEKFGLKYDDTVAPEKDWYHGAGISRQIDLLNYPFVPVRWMGSEWQEPSNKRYHRLPEVNFNQAYKEALIKEFINSKCG